MLYKLQNPPCYRFAPWCVAGLFLLTVICCSGVTLAQSGSLDIDNTNMPGTAFSQFTEVTPGSSVTLDPYGRISSIGSGSYSFPYWEIFDSNGNLLAWYYQGDGSAPITSNENGWSLSYTDTWPQAPGYVPEYLGTEITVTPPSSASAGTYMAVACNGNPYPEEYVVEWRGLFNVLSTTTPISSPTTAPTLNAPVLGPASVKLTWSAVSGASYYNVYRSVYFTGQPQNATINPPPTVLCQHVVATTFYDTTATLLAPGEYYNYQVAAVNASSETNRGSAVPGPLSNEQVYTPGSPVPSAPSGSPATIAVVNGRSNVELYWSPVSGATSYNLLCSTDGGKFTQIASGLTPRTPLQASSIPASYPEVNYYSQQSVLSGNFVSYENANLASGHQYYYEVLSVNGTDPSVTSPPVMATPTTQTVSSTVVGTPTTPSSVSASYPDQTFTSGTGVNLSCVSSVPSNLAVPNITGQDVTPTVPGGSSVQEIYTFVYRSTTSGGEGGTASFTYSGQMGTDSSVVANTQYYYKMRSVYLEDNGQVFESPYSSEVEVKTPTS